MRAPEAAPAQPPAREAPGAGDAPLPQVPPPASTRGLSRRQKAAVVLGVLGPEAAGPILARFDEAALRAFTRAMASLRRVDAATVRAVIAEFLAELGDGEEIVRGGVARARMLLEQHIAEGVLDRVIEEAEPPSPATAWRRLARVPEERLVALLGREHPQTIAVVLSRFPPERAAAILTALPAAVAREAVLGLARLDHLEPQLMAALGEAICAELAASGGAEATGAARRVGAVMDYLGASTREAILAQIEAEEPAFARAVRRAMFTVEDIPTRVPPRAVPLIVRAADQQMLLRALVSLRSEAPQIEEFLLSNISSRMAEQLRSEMKEIAEVPRREAERAQAELVRTVRSLVEAGEIELKEPQDEPETEGDDAAADAG